MFKSLSTVLFLVSSSNMLLSGSNGSEIPRPSGGKAALNAQNVRRDSPNPTGNAHWYNRVHPTAIKAPLTVVTKPAIDVISGTVVGNWFDSALRGLKDLRMDQINPSVNAANALQLTPAVHQ